MSFLSPGTIMIAAGLTIPPLVALYFLKLKRNKHTVPSTLLWKKAVEDLRVNAPFQRLRSSLLLLLQLLVLIAGAVALGEPMWQTVKSHKSTVIVLIDQSASMAVIEPDGKTRLEIAKEQAQAFIDNMDDGARAMVIAFCDRANVISAFDTDKSALKRKIEQIEQTQSTTTLSEAIRLAEAYTQNIIISLPGQEDIEMTSDAAPATVAMFTDGRIEDADDVVLQKFDAGKMEVFTVGGRADNVGVLSMSARRHYEHPEFLQVAANVGNFGADPVELDAVLYVDGVNVDVETVTVPGGSGPEASKPEDETQPGNPTSPGAEGESKPDGKALIVFDDIEFEGSGVVEVALRINDGLTADNHAWTIIDKPRELSVLLVTDGNFFLTDALSAYDIGYTKMTGREYESADDQALMEGKQSKYDVVILDGHSTARLPRGNYFFWGAVPEMDGVAASGTIDDQIIFNWDDTHPILRHVTVENIVVDRWLALTLPTTATPLIEGESSPVLSYFADGGNQYLICAFRLITRDEFDRPVLNTILGTSVDFLILMKNALQFLASNIAAGGRRSVTPGEPVTLPVASGVASVRVQRPDRHSDQVSTAGLDTLVYADTRVVGPFTIKPGIRGRDTFAVNLFSSAESDIRPRSALSIGATTVRAQSGSVQVNEPAWPYLVMILLGIVMIEWVVYNYRVFV